MTNVIIGGFDGTSLERLLRLPGLFLENICLIIEN
jgi:hypothetical protein